jgi:putative membrane protein
MASPEEVDGEAVDGAEVDARFSLANERTFLAWTRTALALVAAGVALSQVTELSSTAARFATGLPLVVVGAVSAWWSYRHYRSVEQALRDGAALPRTRLPAVLALTVGLGAAAAVVLIVIDAA